jgi:hypothetical protein
MYNTVLSLITLIMHLALPKSYPKSIFTSNAMILVTNHHFLDLLAPTSAGASGFFPEIQLAKSPAKSRLCRLEAWLVTPVCDFCISSNSAFTSGSTVLVSIEGITVMAYGCP